MNRLLDSKFMKKVKHDYFSATRIVCKNTTCLSLVDKPDIRKLQSIREIFACSFVDSNNIITETKRNEIFSKKIFPPLDNIIPAIIKSNELVGYLERIIHSGRHFQLTILPQSTAQSQDNPPEGLHETGADIEEEEKKSIKIIRLKRNLKQSSSKNKKANCDRKLMLRAGF